MTSRIVDPNRRERLKLHIDQRAGNVDLRSPLTTPGMSPVARELPMPNVTRIYSLKQAHATLLHCWNKLSRCMQDASAYPSMTGKGSFAAGEQEYFLQWLEKWEQAFSEYLSLSMPSMATDDLTHSRVLKANHLAFTLMAVDAEPETADYDKYEPEFNAILELASAILQARQGSRSPQSASTASPDSSQVTSSLDVRDPLCVVMASTNKRATRNYAGELLSRCYYR